MGKILNIHFTKKGIQIGNKHMKRYLSFVTREIKIKVAMTYHLTSTKKTIIQRQTIAKVGEDMEKLECSYCWWKCKMVPLLWKQLGSFLKSKHKHKRLTILLLVFYPREIKSISTINNSS